MKTNPMLIVAAVCVCATASAIAAEHDYYHHLRYPKELVPGVGEREVGSFRAYKSFS